jgi:hypothetical protein
MPKKDEWTPKQREEIAKRAAALLDEKENWAVRQAEKEMAAKKVAKSRTGLWLLLIAGSVVAVTIAVQNRHDPAEDAARAANVAEAARLSTLTAEQRLAEEAAKAKAAQAAAAAKVERDELDTAITLCREVIRLRLNDPDSAKFEDSTFHEKKNGTWRIQQTFRAKNGFNATRLGTSECYVKDGKLINMKDLR